MKQSIPLHEVDFGQPEAEHDAPSIERSFYEADSWKLASKPGGMPFVVGRKGSVKSAIAFRLQYVSSQQATRACFIRFVPADFRHVEIRDLLSCLVNKTTSWQYIYRKVWEGIILGQMVRHLQNCTCHHNSVNELSPDLHAEMRKFTDTCAFYVSALGDALSEVITKHVKEVSKKTDALSQVELRKRIEPYTWSPLVQALARHSANTNPLDAGMFIVIDGLDEHWDTSDASLFFLAELLAVSKDFTAKFGRSVRFLICLRDNIFRTLVDTKSIEYDKIESLIINLEWNSRSLFEMIARRVAPAKRLEKALIDLRELLPATIDGCPVEDYLARHILQRPRDYINFFRMLQKECSREPRAGEGHIQDTVARYCANRLTDLENEFGFTYPNITKCIVALPDFPPTFDKELLLEKLGELCQRPSFRAQAPQLMESYGQPIVLARILVSIGVIGIYDARTHALRFIHEFSESRVTNLWQSADLLGIHPVYAQRKARDSEDKDFASHTEVAPAIIAHPEDYVAAKDSLDDLESYDQRLDRRCKDLIASLAAIDEGQPHFRRFELWVKDTLSLCFMGDLLNAEEQLSTQDGGKRFEVIFDVVGNEPPWPEIKGKYRTHRLLVECKNTDEPTDADINKIDRDMLSLDVDVAFLAFRGSSREPRGKLLNHQRAAFINSNRRRVIVSLSNVFLLQCLEKQTSKKCRHNLNKLWRDHVHIWLQHDLVVAHICFAMNLNTPSTAQLLGALLKSVCDIMRKNKGLNGDLDRLPMLTWIMFLKFLDELEIQREGEAKLAGKRFKPAIESPYRWRDWAATPNLANRPANSLRPSTSPNSITIAVERHNVPGALIMALTRRAGDPLQSVPEASKLVSTTSFTAGALRTDFVHNLLDFLQAHRPTKSGHCPYARATAGGGARMNKSWPKPRFAAVLEPGAEAVAGCRRGPAGRSCLEESP